jgi:hypothetical protein
MYKITPNAKIDIAKILLVILTLCVISPDASGQLPYAERSILADGDVYKLEISTTGIYQIDRDYLVDLGVNVDGLSTSSIHIYGNGGGRLPERVGDERFDDLTQNAITIIGGEDGRLDDGDRIIFYAEGPDAWSYSVDRWVWDENPYANHNYYYLKIGGQEATRVQGLDLGAADVVHESIYRCQHHEVDRVNLLGDFALTEGTGQQWFGEYFNSQRTQSFDEYFSLEDLREGSDVEVEVLMAARSKSSSRLELQVANESFSRPVSAVGSSSTSIYARRVAFREQVAAVAPFTLDVNYPTNGTVSEAWLDYITVRADHRVEWSGDVIEVFTTDVDGQVHGWTQSPSSPYRLWDVTHHNEVVELANTYMGDEPRRLLAWRSDATYPSPVAQGRVANQNLHGIDNVDMLVVYPSVFESEALRYVEHRSLQAGLAIEAVTMQQVAEEFGSGKGDPTAIRDFVKMVYEKSNQRLKYLLLFGDASYDYRHLLTEHADQNFVPTYQTKASLHPVDNFPTDDYYALLNDDEGADLIGALDIAVGRFPVNTLSDASSTVDKVIEYDGNNFGDWKVRHTWVADDEDSSTHFKQSERVATKTDVKYADFNSTKIYLDAYEQVSTPGGERYPDASEALTQSFQRGQLMINYLGHGGPRGWAQERVLQLNDIQQWNNPGQYPLMITATCTFTGFDDPAVVSGGEASFLRQRSGVIGLFTTTRAVYANDNERLVSSVTDTLYSKVDGEAQRFGDIIRKSKNGNSADTLRANARKFVLIGDPSQQIDLPEHDIVVTTVNDTPIDDLDTPVGALEKVTVEAEVRDGVTGTFMSMFSGEATVTVYDKASRLRLLNNDPTSRPGEFDALSNILFRGKVPVRQGIVTFSFVVPSDINYEVGAGRISIYAHNDVVDAAGSTSALLVGGGGRGVSDDVGPDVVLYMNDRSFVDGGLTSANPLLIVDLADDLGINVTGNSIGHDLVATLTGPFEDTYVLNDFYEASPQGFTEGTAMYQLQDLPPGDYTISVKAWDAANNSGEASLLFRVTDGPGLEISDLYNYPNPYTSTTIIRFDHNLLGYYVEGDLLVYDMQGREIKRFAIATTLTESFLEFNFPGSGGIPELDDLYRTLVYPYTLNLRIPELDNLSLTRSASMLRINDR